MVDLPSVTSREVIRALERAGFQTMRQRGSHVFLLHTERGKATVVPSHAGDLRPALVRKIVRDAGLSVDEFVKLLRG